jgi:hypothetical protein
MTLEWIHTSAFGSNVTPRIIIMVGVAVLFHEIQFALKTIWRMERAGTNNLRVNSGVKIFLSKNNSSGTLGAPEPTHHH